MKIYFGHSKSFDYENEYYKPIEQNKRLQIETLIFPHKKYCIFQTTFYKLLNVDITFIYKSLRHFYF